MEVETVIGTHRLVHLDLKRAPIKPEYLQQLLPLIKTWGATGLLLEWEDTFPYFGDLTCIGSLNTKSQAYSASDIDKIHSLAELSNLIVVPLVQTFGHLEFVLKHEEWREMREVSRYPNSLCPSHPRSLNLVTSMIDQVISKSPKTLKYFHIGADEVWQLGVCSACSDQDRNLVLLNHVSAVLRHIHHHYPHVRPIMWDDMLRNIDSQLLKGFEIGELVDPMIWIYEPAPSFFLSDDMWRKYNDVFENVWVASAFKGATGCNQILPIVRHHVGNHEIWLEEITRRGGGKVVGLAITGWSRYDHYATLCELLPTAIPCLALCLRIWLNRGFDEAVHKTVSSTLGYKHDLIQLVPFPRPQPVTGELNFPGWRVCIGVEWFANLQAKHHGIVSSEQVATWLNPWQIKNNFTNPMQIQGLVGALFELCREWEAFESYMKANLSEVYYEPTIEEWMYTQVFTLKQAAKQLHSSGEKQLANDLKSRMSAPPAILQEIINSKEAMVEEPISEDMNDSIEKLDIP